MKLDKFFFILPLHFFAKGLKWGVLRGCLLLAFSRLEDGKLNSRGFSNPWNTSWFNYRTVCKDGEFNPWDFQVLGHVAVPRLSDAISSSLLFPRT